MSRLTQRPVVSPEHLPLPLGPGGSDRTCWLPEGSVFSNVQRQKIISKFLKESVLKRVFGSQPARWEGPHSPQEDPSRSFPSTRKDFKKSSVETGFGVTRDPTRLFALNPSLTSAQADRQVGSNRGLRPPLGLCWPNADGDFSKDRNEPPRDQLCATMKSKDGEALCGPSWNVGFGNGSVEDDIMDESDFSENEKANEASLSYFKKMGRNVKPDATESAEEPSPEQPREAFPYPDILPRPLGALDLRSLALSKAESWRATVEPRGGSTEHLVTRLLELEWLQHVTIQKERPRFQSAFGVLPAADRPSSSSSTALPKTRQPKPPDSGSLQTACGDETGQKRKMNPGSCRLDPNTSRWNWGGADRWQWIYRPLSLKSPPAATLPVAAQDDLKSPRSTLLSPCQELPAEPPAAQTPQSLGRRSPRLPPKSAIPVSPIRLSFPKHPRGEMTAPRTRKKLYPKAIVLSRPFYIQKLNCLPTSFLAQCSPVEQK